MKKKTNHFTTAVNNWTHTEILMHWLVVLLPSKNCSYDYFQEAGQKQMMGIDFFNFQQEGKPGSGGRGMVVDACEG